MIKQLIISLVFLISYSAKADFVDIAILKVNGVLVRKLTNNNQNPYFVNLSSFHVGDTLNIQIRTDHGAEENAYVSIKNLENNHKFVLTRENQFIISTELLQKKHLLSVTYVRDYPEEIEITWDICKIIPDDQIEKVYSSIDEFCDFLLSVSNGKPNFYSSILADSITTNYVIKPSGKGFPEKILKDTLNYPITKMCQFLILNNTEKLLIKNIRAIDYVSLYDFSSNLYGSIVIGDEDIDTFMFMFGDFTHLTRCYFQYSNGKYKLKKLLFEKLK